MKDFIDFFLNNSFLWKFLLYVWMLLTSLFSFGQEPNKTELFKKLYQKDSIIFERTFNKGELEKLAPIIASNFEFYHDVAGIQDRATFLKAVKNNICRNNDAKFIRKLVPNSLEVFPLKKNGKLYGAIQRG